MTEQRWICPGRALYLHGMIILCLNLINLKVIFRWDEVMEAEMVISFYLAYFFIPIVINLGFVVNVMILYNWYDTG